MCSAQQTTTKTKILQPRDTSCHVNKRQSITSVSVLYVKTRDRIASFVLLSAFRREGYRCKEEWCRSHHDSQINPTIDTPYTLQPLRTTSRTTTTMSRGAECLCMAIIWLLVLIFVAWPLAFLLVFLWIFLQVSFFDEPLAVVLPEKPTNTHVSLCLIVTNAAI